VVSAYPASTAERDSWILSQRPQRNTLDPLRPYAFLMEEEYSHNGILVPIATVFLTNRECPWRCVMCDLWRNTLVETVPDGAIPMQIEYALSRLGPARQIKLYNSGSFFDPHAIPEGDYPAIANKVAGFECVIVESHPALLGDRSLRFQQMLHSPLEVAMGLETVHEETLSRLNKRMTLEQFRAAAHFTKRAGMELRVFILIKPPFMNEDDGLTWTRRSIDFAFDCGAGVVSLIPTRGGNGAMEALASQNQFAPPSLDTIEAAASYGMSLKHGRVFVDLWDIPLFSACSVCREPRAQRLQMMNRQQTIPEAVPCGICGGGN
jgi:archaeosine synthase beta-subunit